MVLKTTAWETTDYLRTKAQMTAYLEAALEENDPAFFQSALGIVARAQGMQAVADKSNATRAGLYKALSTDGNPEFATVYRVVKALGCRLAVVSDRKPRKAAVKPRNAKSSAAGTVSKSASRTGLRVPGKSL